MKAKAIFSFILLLSLVWGLKTQTSSAQTTTSIPAGEFNIRGFHIDLRIQVMTLHALKNFAKELACFGINTIVMEWEASYPYEKHATISNELAYTREEIQLFINYCQQIGIDVIPLEQCFGHVEYILRNDRYGHLKEDRKDISQVCPLKTKADSSLFADLFADMVSLHSSKYIHIGGDETYLLGHCAECSKKVQKEGKSKLFADYMKMMCGIVTKLGKIPVMWADILLKYPESATELPKETVFIDWNYGWKTNYFGDISSLQQKGLTFWGAPAIRSHPDNWYITCWEKHFNNQRDFIPYARKAGYEGIIMTSWSTSGLYGFTWDVGYDVVDMEQIRNTYPLSGFRILVAAYAQALKQPGPINPQNFVVQYAGERFGLEGNDPEKFWQALIVPPEPIVEGQPTSSRSIAEMRATLDTAREIMNGLKPVRNQKEFEHFRLMLDLRDHYLAFKELEAKYNSENFTRKDVKQLIPELEQLLAGSKNLDKRFSSLNKEFLYDSEIQDQNRIRNLKLHELYHRLIQDKPEKEQDTLKRTLNFPKQTMFVDSLPEKKNVWVFILAGQSNMAGRGWVEPQDTVPNPQIISINKENQWIYAKEPLHFYQPQLTGLDCGMSFARELINHLDSNIVIALLPCAVGGSSVNFWLNDSTFHGIHLKSNFMEKVELAKKRGVLKGILWHQGESDASENKIPGYEHKLKKLFAFFREYAGNKHLPVFVGELGSYPVPEKMKTNWQSINHIIHHVAATDKYVFCIHTSDLEPKEDNIHFNSTSQRMLGQRYAEVYLKLLHKTRK
jgi:hexosaminidase